MVRFGVSDTGIGMTAEQLAGCSRRSARPTPRPRKRFGGTGLGLAITQHFCQHAGRRHHGREQAGQGLDLHHHACRTESVRRAAGTRPRRAVPRRRTGARTVLVVDDDPAVRDLLARALLERKAIAS